MSDVGWILVCELAGIAGGVISVWIADAIDRFRWCRFMRQFGAQPIANVAMPTVTELRRADWMTGTLSDGSSRFAPPG